MTTAPETHPVIAIKNSFYVVDRPFRVGALGEEVALMQVQLGDQPPHAPRMMAVSVLHTLVESGDAVFVDAGLLRAAARRLARRRTDSDGTGGQATPGAKPAFERLLLLLKSGDVRSAAAMLDPDDALEPV
jgi:hypothetical protein